MLRGVVVKTVRLVNAEKVIIRLTSAQVDGLRDESYRPGVGRIAYKSFCLPGTAHTGRGRRYDSRNGRTAKPARSIQRYPTSDAIRWPPTDVLWGHRRSTATMPMSADNLYDS